MSDINLLPENLRDKEGKAKRRVSRRSGEADMDLAIPEDEKKPDMDSGKYKKSWLMTFFGESKPKKAKPINIGVVSQSASDNSSVKAKDSTPFKVKQPAIRPQPVNAIESTNKAPASDRKSHRWFKSAQPNNKKDNQKSITGKNNLNLQSEAKNEKPLEIKSAPKISIQPENAVKPVKTGDNWWSILLSMFKGKKKIKPMAEAQMNVASSDAQQSNVKINKTVTITAPKSEKVATVKSSGNKKSKKDKDGDFHLAPKAKKSQFSINLMPEELIFRKQANRRSQTLVMILAIILPVLAIYGVNYLIDEYQRHINEELAQRQVRIAQLKVEVDDYQRVREQNLFFQQKVSRLYDIFNERIYWTNFFSLLERYTLDSVYYTNFSVNVKGDFVLPAVATNYGEAAKQIAAFQSADDFIEKVDVSRLTLMSDNIAGITGVSLEFKLKLVDGVFKNK